MNENETSISDSVHDIFSIHIDNTNCCTQLNIPSECHFLCGVGSQPFWSITRWKCTHKYYAKVATCEVQNKISKYNFPNKWLWWVLGRKKKLMMDILTTWQGDYKQQNLSITLTEQSQHTIMYLLLHLGWNDNLCI